MQSIGTIPIQMLFKLKTQDGSYVNSNIIDDIIDNLKDFIKEKHVPFFLLNNRLNDETFKEELKKYNTLDCSNETYRALCLKDIDQYINLAGQGYCYRYDDIGKDLLLLKDKLNLKVFYNRKELATLLAKYYTYHPEQFNLLKQNLITLGNEDPEIKIYIDEQIYKQKILT
jgi:hypothetical protein